MLRQLKALRDEMFRGHYYVHDAIRCRAASGGGDQPKDGDDDEKGEGMMNSRVFTLSRFNPAKRVRFPPVIQIPGRGRHLAV
ncbi:hypothetical protein BAE44_0005240 [Dichanthelium oligosanthes]|uniref:Uncharacterized protein n=1 Tax=Dichanthelium oligosanthes TaxID=888268 RepID=A0A1E5W8N1_9POAL|nr:hypothetical protein BAE44_0005240 [Dichanthelium oligosanthes]